MPVGPIDSTPSNPSWPPPVQYLPGALPPPRRRRRIHWGAVVAIVSSVVLVVCGGVVAYFPDDVGAVVHSVVRAFSGGGNGSSPSDSADGIMSTAELKPGMCLAAKVAAKDTVNTLPGALPVVDCAETHASEVVGTFTMAKGKYPGASGFQRQATERCFGLFRDYVVTVTPEMLKLQAGFLAPTAVQWSLGNRVVACLVGDSDGKSKGSIKD
jgi:hypothetical protein